MNKIVLTIVGIVGVFSLFALIGFFKNDPTALAPYGYSPYGYAKCELPNLNKELPYKTCVEKGIEICDKWYFKEPQIMTGWDYCYTICKNFIYDACK